jgi:hypothetical protein
MSLNPGHSKYLNLKLPEYDSKVMKKNVTILYGEDNTGDLLNVNNIEYLVKNIPLVDIVTADGGFDEGSEYNNKEILHLELINNEINCALKKLKPNGHFILKVFDTFSQESKDMITHLYKNFKEVWIYKPYTSRPTNSERYIICKFFENTDKDVKYINNCIDVINKDYYKLQAHALRKAINNSNTETLNFIRINEKLILDHKNNIFQEWKNKFN